MKNKLRKKAQRTINKYVHALNKNIQKDNLWRGRFVFRQTDSYWEEFEDRSGGILKVVIEARDLKTGKFWEFAMDNYDRGWHLFENANKFIAAGNKVKISMRFRGRELNFISQGKEIMQNFCDMLDGVQIDKSPKMEGKNLTMFLSPSKNK